MTYVMIIISVLATGGFNSNGVATAIHSVEFSSRDSCEAAARTVAAEPPRLPRDNPNHVITARCYLK